MQSRFFLFCSSYFSIRRKSNSRLTRTKDFSISTNFELSGDSPSSSTHNLDFRATQAMTLQRISRQFSPEVILNRRNEDQWKIFSPTQRRDRSVGQQLFGTCGGDDTRWFWWERNFTTVSASTETLSLIFWKIDWNHQLKVSATSLMMFRKAHYDISCELLLKC